MRESKTEERLAKKSLKSLVDVIHAKRVDITWLHLYDLLDELADYAWSNYLQDLKNYEANKKTGLAALKKKAKL